MNARYLLCIAIAAVCCLLLPCLSGSVAGQTVIPPALSFADLPGRIVPGMDVTAIDSSGKKIHGLVTGITDSALVLEDQGNKITYSDANLAEVHQRQQDSLLNGLLIGASVGAVPLALTAAWCQSEGDCGGSTYALATVLYCGTGAAVGVLLDSLIKKDVVIYRRVQMSPTIGTAGRRHSPGLGVSLRW